jgi:hypothetical protein
MPCLGLTTQARQRGSIGGAFDSGRKLFAWAVPLRPQRLDGFYDREPAVSIDEISFTNLESHSQKFLLTEDSNSYT